MTVRERVITNRLIMKIDSQTGYAEQIGLSYNLVGVKSHDNADKNLDKNSSKKK